MQLHLFADRGAIPGGSRERDDLERTLGRIARDTDTRDLVVAAYLVGRHSHWKAHTVIGWRTPDRFVSTGRGWRFTRRFGRPGDLPDRFRLIRMAFGLAEAYPRTFVDVHGWRLTCACLAAHVGYTFAHELHHHRRYHLGRHPGEGEQAACRWAVARLRELGLHVEAVRLPRRRRRRRRPRYAGPHFERLRALPDGARLRIVADGRRAAYVGETAVKIRTLRRNSYRLGLRTADGREWLWPMQWLKAADDE